MQDKERLKEYIRSAWDGYQKLNNAFFYRDRQNISKIRQYMNGSIDVTKYQKILIPKELANEDDTGANMNWAPLDVYSKYRRIAIQVAKFMKEDLNIEAVDSQAVNEREEFFADSLAKMYVRDKLIQQGINPEEVIAGVQDLPESLKELEMFMSFSFKSIAAMEFETALDKIKTDCKWNEETYTRLLEDMHDLGVSVVRVVEENDGEIRAEYVDPESFVCSHSYKHGFDDLEMAGEMLEMSLAECSRFMEDEDRRTKMDFEEINNIMKGTNPDNDHYRELSESLRDHQDLTSADLKVLHLEFRTGEKEEYELRKTKEGNLVFGHKSNGKKGKEFSSAQFDVVYEGYWILGTDIFFGIKKKDFVLRDPRDVKKALLSYHVFAPEVNHMNINSMGKQAMPSIDAINIAWGKLQNAILRAKPSGVAYDLTALESVEQNQSDFDPKMNVATYNMTGNMAFRSIDEDGNMSRVPIIPLAGGLGKEGQEFMQQIKFNEDMFRSITGLNEITDGSSPNPRTLKSVAQQAALSSNNALRFLHESVQRVDLDVSRDIIQRILDQAEAGDEIEFYRSSIGDNSIKFFKLSKDHSMRSLGLSFVPQPTQEEEQNFNEMLRLALSTPEGGKAQITIAQKARLDSIKNKKHALMYLSYIVDKNMETQERKKREDMQLQSQLNQQAAMTAEQAKQQTLQLDAQVKASLIDREWQWRMQVAQIEAGSRIGQENVKAEARDRESQRTFEGKMGVANVQASSRAEQNQTNQNEEGQQT